MIIDANHRYDSGSPSFAAGINIVERFCEVTEVSLRKDPCRDCYVNGWGDEGLDPTLVIDKWELNQFDIEYLSFSFDFDIMRGSSPIII